MLNADIVANIDQLLSRETLLTSGLFVCETATNRLKYGQSGADIKLYIDGEDSEVALMMSNQIGSEPTEYALMGDLCEVRGGAICQVKDYVLTGEYGLMNM